MKKTLVVLASAPLLLVGTAVRAQDSTPRRGPTVEMKQSGTPGKAVATRTMKVTASVYAIDPERRIVTLQNEMGGTETFKVGPDVKRLDQISPEIINKIGGIVHQRLKGLGQVRRQSYVGVRAVAELLAGGLEAGDLRRMQNRVMITQPHSRSSKKVLQ